MSPTHPNHVPPSPFAQPAAQPQPTRVVSRSSHIRVSHIEVWSVLKLSFALSVVMGAVAVGASAALFMALDHLGVISSVNDVFNTYVRPPANGATARATSGPLTLSAVLTVVAALSAFAVVLTMTGATLTAAAYNAVSRITGGLSVTLNES